MVTPAPAMIRKLLLLSTSDDNPLEPNSVRAGTDLSDLRRHLFASDRCSRGSLPGHTLHTARVFYCLQTGLPRPLAGLDTTSTPVSVRSTRPHRALVSAEVDGWMAGWMGHGRHGVTQLLAMLWMVACCCCCCYTAFMPLEHCLDLWRCLDTCGLRMWGRQRCRGLQLCGAWLAVTTEVPYAVRTGAGGQLCRLRPHVVDQSHLCRQPSW